MRLRFIWLRLSKPILFWLVKTKIYFISLKLWSRLTLPFILYILPLLFLFIFLLARDWFAMLLISYIGLHLKRNIRVAPSEDANHIELLHLEWFDCILIFDDLTIIVQVGSTSPGQSHPCDLLKHLFALHSTNLTLYSGLSLTWKCSPLIFLTHTFIKYLYLIWRYECSSILGVLVEIG